MVKHTRDMLSSHIADLDCEIATVENEIGRLIKRRDPLYTERDLARLAYAALPPEEDE